MPTTDTLADYKDIKQTGLDLDLLYKTSPKAYYYIKGYIQHAIDAKEGTETTDNIITKEHKSSA